MVDGAGTGLRTISRDPRPRAHGWLRPRRRRYLGLVLHRHLGAATPSRSSIRWRRSRSRMAGSRPPTSRSVASRRSRCGSRTSASTAGRSTRPPSTGCACGTSSGRRAGRSGLVPSGLAAQDSLRLEKGYRLWGQDIHTEFDPLESGLDFTVAWDKGDFIGRDALLRKRDTGLTRRLSALVLDDREVVLMNREPILARRREGRLRDVGQLRLRDGPLDRVRLSADRAGPTRPAGRPAVLRRPLPGDGRRGAALRPDERPAARPRGRCRTTTSARAPHRATAPDRRPAREPARA